MSIILYIVVKKLSYCCDSRSYCMQKYDRLKQLLRDTLSSLFYATPNVHCIFIVIAASRPVNKNVNTGAVVRADRAGRSNFHEGPDPRTLAGSTPMPTAKVSKGTNRNMYARNTLVKLLALYTDPESHNAQRYRQRDRQTDGQQAAANSRSYCVAVRSGKKYFQCAVIPSLTMGVYLHSFSRCSLSNMPTSAKFRKNLNVQQFKVIQLRSMILVPIESAYASSS